MKYIIRYGTSTKKWAVDPRSAELKKKGVKVVTKAHKDGVGYGWTWYLGENNVWYSVYSDGMALPYKGKNKF